MPRVDSHVPHIPWIEHEEIGMTGFVRDGFGCNPIIDSRQFQYLFAFTSVVLQQAREGETWAKAI